MAFLVRKGDFKILKGRKGELVSEFLGGGIGIALLDKENSVAGLGSYLFPFKEDDIEFDELFIRSGETLLPEFVSAFEKEGGDLQKSKIVLAGASLYKKGGHFVKNYFTSFNLEVARKFFQEKGIEEDKILFKIEFPHNLKLGISLERMEVFLQILKDVKRL